MTDQTPDRTALFVEGCADVDPARLVESWARHTLAWIARWEDEGPRPLHAEWRGLALQISASLPLSSSLSVSPGDRNGGRVTSLILKLEEQRKQEQLGCTPHRLIACDFLRMGAGV